MGYRICAFHRVKTVKNTHLLIIVDYHRSQIFQRRPNIAVVAFDRDIRREFLDERQSWFLQISFICRG